MSDRGNQRPPNDGDEPDAIHHLGTGVTDFPAVRGDQPTSGRGPRLRPRAREDAPARQAGIDHRTDWSRPSRRPKPRARGDRPVHSHANEFAAAAPPPRGPPATPAVSTTRPTITTPHTRGSTMTSQPPVIVKPSFPTPAGTGSNPAHGDRPSWLYGTGTSPSVHNPAIAGLHHPTLVASRTTPPEQNSGDPLQPRPAQTDILPHRRSTVGTALLGLSEKRDPRARGDQPSETRSAESTAPRAGIDRCSPARAGIGPGPTTTCSLRRVVPRVCGDRPLVFGRRPTYAQATPHRRGSTEDRTSRPATPRVRGSTKRRPREAIPAQAGIDQSQRSAGPRVPAPRAWAGIHRTNSRRPSAPAPPRTRRDPHTQGSTQPL